MSRLATPIRRNDTVVVTTGKDRGKRGRVLKVLPEKNRVIVERVNMIKRHVRPNPSKNIAGGISEKEAPIQISNVMLVDPDRNTRTRIGRRRDADGTPERYAKMSGAALT
jgi:large subunit ribosomal protein L24